MRKFNLSWVIPLTFLAILIALIVPIFIKKPPDINITEARNAPIVPIVVEKIEPNVILPGNFDIQLKVRNQIDTTLQDVHVILELPAGLHFVDSSVKPAKTDPPTWVLPKMDPQETVSITVKLRGEPGKHLNRVKVRALQPIISEAQRTVEVLALAGLTASLSDSPGVALVGEKIRYQLVLKAQGFGAVKGIIAKVSFPKEMRIDSVETELPHEIRGHDVQIGPFELSKGDELKVIVVATPEAAGDLIVKALIGHEGFKRAWVIEEGTIVYEAVGD